MIDLIKAATLSTSKEQRVNAEQQIIQLRLENTENFFTESCAILQNETLPTNIRQASGTVVDMSILVETPKGYLWDNLSPTSKQQVREAVLSVMIDKDRNIRRAAANIVATICCIQIPRNEWDGIVETISQNISNEDPVVKEVSILTLGFICERLKDKKSFVFNLKLQEVILTGILLGLKESQKQIVETALKALRDGVASMADILQNPQYRDYLVNQTVSIIQTQNYKNYGLQILTQFAKGCYNHLKHYINGFVTLFQPIITNTKEEDNCIQSMEFWETVATEYKYLSEEDPNLVNYIQGTNGEKIVSWLLQNLCAINDDDDQNEQNGIVQSASKCLESIFEDSSAGFEKLVLNFTSNTLKHQNWKYRQASIRAFACFLVGLEEKRKQQLLNASLLELLSLLNDTSKHVQVSAIKSLALMTEDCAQIFLNHANFLDILKLVVGKSSQSQTFLRNVCKIIDNLCLSSYEQGTNHFYSIADDLIQVFFDSCLTSDSSLHVINCCILTIMNLINACFNPTVSKKYITFVINHFSQIGKLQAQKRQLLYSSFFTLLQTCLISLRKQNIQMETLSTIYNLVINHYSSLNKVDSDGLYVVGSLSNFFRDQTRLVDDFWKYVDYSLNQYNESHIFKAALSCVCDFASNYGPSLGNERIKQIMTHLLTAFQKPQVSRQSKLDIIMCLGEMFLNCGSTCEEFLEETMKLIILACQASISMGSNDQQYAQTLRQYIIETLTCILHGMNDGEHICNQILASMDNVLGFIKVTCDKSYQPKLKYVKSCVLWMADAAKFYQQHVQSKLRQPWVYQCLEKLKQHNKNGNLNDVIAYAKANF